MKTLFVTLLCILLVSNMFAAPIKNLEKWEGVVQIGGKFSVTWYYMQLSFPDAGNEGTARFQPFTDYWAGVEMENDTNTVSFPVKVRIDSLLRKFQFVLNGEIERQGRQSLSLPRKLHGFSGYLSPEGDRLIGVMKDSPMSSSGEYTIISSPEIFKKDKKVYIKFSKPKNGPRKGQAPGNVTNRNALRQKKEGRYAKLVGLPLAEEKIIEWYAKQKKEYPDKNSNHPSLGGLAIRNHIRLFQDTTFVPAFGKRFDDYSVGELYALSWSFQQLRQSRDIRLVDLAKLSSMFSPQGTAGSAHETQIAIMAMRGIHKWMEGQREKLKKATEPTDIKRLSREITKVAGAHYWPSEVEALKKETEQ